MVDVAIILTSPRFAIIFTFPLFTRVDVLTFPEAFTFTQFTLPLAINSVINTLADKTFNDSVIICICFVDPILTAPVPATIFTSKTASKFTDPFKASK